MFSQVTPDDPERRSKLDFERTDPERPEINDFLADTGVWISGGVIVALVLWLVLMKSGKKPGRDAVTTAGHPNAGSLPQT